MTIPRLLLILLLLPTNALASDGFGVDDFVLLVVGAIALVVGVALWMRAHGKEKQVNDLIAKAVDGAAGLFDSAKAELLQHRELVEKQRAALRNKTVELQRANEVIDAVVPTREDAATPTKDKPKVVNGGLTL